MADILELSDVSKSFGAVTVADCLSYTVREGEALGVIGPNGAGKTSMFNLITGTLSPNAGRVVFLGRDITRDGAAARCRAGMARSFQVPQPFGGLTVFENAMIAATQGADLHVHEAEGLCLDVLEDTGLLDTANRQAGSLALLDRKRLELTRALCAKPKRLMLDEIAGGLTDAECHSLIDTIRKINQNGMLPLIYAHLFSLQLMRDLFARQVSAGKMPQVTEAPSVQV